MSDPNRHRDYWTTWCEREFDDIGVGVQEGGKIDHEWHARLAWLYDVVVSSPELHETRRAQLQDALREIRRLAKAEPFYMSAGDRLPLIAGICGKALSAQPPAANPVEGA